MRKRKTPDLILKGAGYSLKSARTAKRISLRELERKTGISRSLLSRYENDEVGLATDVLTTIADAMDVPMPCIVIDYLRRKHPDLPQSNSKLSKALDAIAEMIGGSAT